MYKCDKCGCVSLPNERMNKVVVNSVPRNYYNLVMLNLNTKKKEFFSFKEKNFSFIKEKELNGYKFLRDFYSKGSEIKKEISLCSKCNEENKCH